MSKATVERNDSRTRTDQAKTSPRGMSPDRAHANAEQKTGKTNRETEETFDNTRNNSGVKQSHQVK